MELTEKYIQEHNAKYNISEQQVIKENIPYYNLIKNTDFTKKDNNNIVKEGKKKGKFIMVKHSTIDIFMDKSPSIMSLYLHLQQHVGNWDRKKVHAGQDKFDLYNKYYLAQEKICASISTIELGKRLGVSRQTIMKWTKKLENDGIIKKIIVGKFGQKGKNKPYCIYQLGYVKDGKDFYFVEEL